MKLLSTDGIATSTSELLSTDDSNWHQLICYLLLIETGIIGFYIYTANSNWH